MNSYRWTFRKAKSKSVGHHVNNKCQIELRLTCLLQTPEHLARHPMGKVPAISFPNGFKLSESRPICKYLARKYSMPLLPSSSDIEATAKFEEAEVLETLYFATPAGKISFEKMVKKFLGLPADDEAVKQAEKELEAFLDVADGILHKQGYFAGEDFSLVDIYYLPIVQRLFVCGYEDLFKSRPGWSTWVDRCMSRPAVREIIQSGPTMKQ